MIEINLLPGAGKKKSSRRQSVDLKSMVAGMSGHFRDPFLLVAVAAVVAAAAAVGGLYLTQGRTEAQLTERHEAAVRDSTRYAHFLKDRYRAEATRDTLLRQVNIIRTLDGDRFVWPHIMDEVSRALPQYTWLTVLGYAGTPQGSTDVVALPRSPADTSAKNKNKPPKRLDTTVPLDPITIRIMGRTVDIQAMTRFMKDLEASPFLSNVQIDQSQLALDQGKEVTQFQLTLAYSRPDTLQLHRVPVSLSVK